MSTTDEATEYDTLSEFGFQMRKLDGELKWLREKRDELIYDIYMRRAMTVTDMAKCAGIGRESVHDIINKQKARASG